MTEAVEAVEPVEAVEAVEMSQVSGRRDTSALRGNGRDSDRCDKEAVESAAQRVASR
jgi:hypothetical protein